MFVTRQIWEFFNLEKIWENPDKLIPHAKLSFKNVSPSCYDIKFIQILSFNIGPWNPNQPLIVECVIQCFTVGPHTLCTPRSKNKGKFYYKQNILFVPKDKSDWRKLSWEVFFNLIYCFTIKSEGELEI